MRCVQHTVTVFDINVLGACICHDACSVHNCVMQSRRIYAVPWCQELFDLLIFAVGRDNRVCTCYLTINYTFPLNNNFYIYLIMYATFFGSPWFQMMSNYVWRWPKITETCNIHYWVNTEKFSCLAEIYNLFFC